MIMSKSGIEPKASSTAVKSQDQRYVANYKYLIVILLLPKFRLYTNIKKILFLKVFTGIIPIWLVNVQYSKCT